MMRVGGLLKWRWWMVVGLTLQQSSSSLPANRAWLVFCRGQRWEAAPQG